MSDALIEFGQIKMRVPVRIIKNLTQDLFKECFTTTLHQKIQFKIEIAVSDVLQRASRGIKTGGEETRLIDAFKAALSFGEQTYKENIIELLSFDVLDKLLEIKSGKHAGKGIGWWRVLEGKNNIVTNNEYMFIGKDRTGKFGEGFLIHKDDVQSRKFIPHSYNISDKRYVTRFINNLTEQTLDNESFMDEVMTTTVAKMIQIAKMGGKKLEASE